MPSTGRSLRRVAGGSRPRYETSAEVDKATFHRANAHGEAPCGLGLRTWLSNEALPLAGEMTHLFIHSTLK